MKSKERQFTIRKDASIKIAELNRKGIHFIVSRTQSSCKIKIPSMNECYFKGASNYTFKEMNAQRFLKKAVHENIVNKNLEVPDISPSDIKYSQFSSYILNELPLDQKISNFVEFDITKAYYKVAHNLGYISEEMYLKYIDLPKKVRLRFLGSIATKKRKYVYDKGKMVGEPEIFEDKLLRKVWFHIVSETDKCMTEFMNIVKDNFLMYYVDGIYLLEADYKETLKYIQEKYRVDFKEEKVESLYRKWDKSAKAFVITITKWNEDKKKFVPKAFYLKTPKDFEGGGYKNLCEENNIHE
jgi:hypothetical protein